MAELTLLYDEGCVFCARLALRLARRPGIEAEPIGSATGSLLLRDLTPTERYAAVHVVDALGRRRTGGAALPPILDELPAGRLPAAACRRFPAITERAYRLVALNRAAIGKLVPGARASPRHDPRAAHGAQGRRRAAAAPAPRASRAPRRP